MILSFFNGYVAVCTASALAGARPARLARGQRSALAAVARLTPVSLTRREGLGPR